MGRLSKQLWIHTPIPSYTTWAGIDENASAEVLKEYIYVKCINATRTIHITIAWSCICTWIKKCVSAEIT
jgi:hypothetical protein